MSRLLTLAVALLAALSVFTRIPVAETAQLNRDLLWAAVQVCVAAYRNIGVGPPCQAVDLGAADRPGTALLRVPGAATHHVLMPIGDLAGLEAPELQGPVGEALFKAAWAARAAVVAGSSKPLRLADVGLAINSPMARSQDHMHMHLDCVGSPVRAMLRAIQVGDAWTWSPRLIEGRRYVVRRVRGSALASLNPFAALVQFLPDRKLVSQASLAVVPGEGPDLYLIGEIRPNAMTETLLDHRCSG